MCCKFSLIMGSLSTLLETFKIEEMNTDGRKHYWFFNVKRNVSCGTATTGRMHSGSVCKTHYFIAFIFRHTVQ